MPRYTFRCDECGAEIIEEMTFAQRERFDPAAIEHDCVGGFAQVMRFAFARSMPEHFNHSLGTYLSSERAAKSELSRQSDEMSARMGFEHKYELVDPGDPASVGVTDAGMEATERRAVDEKRVEPKLYL